MWETKFLFFLHLPKIQINYYKIHVIQIINGIYCNVQDLNKMESLLDKILCNNFCNKKKVWNVSKSSQQTSSLYRWVQITAKILIQKDVMALTFKTFTELQTCCCYCFCVGKNVLNLKTSLKLMKRAKKLSNDFIKILQLQKFFFIKVFSSSIFRNLPVEKHTLHINVVLRK